MGVVTVPLGIPVRLTCAIAAGCHAGCSRTARRSRRRPRQARRCDIRPEPSESDLRHQLQLHSGFGAAAAGGGWTFVPRVSLEEIYTDNVLNTDDNRRWDMLTLLTPGITIKGDTAQRPGAALDTRPAIPPGCQDAAREQRHAATDRHRAVHHRAGRVLCGRAGVRRRRHPCGGGFGALGTGVLRASEAPGAACTAWTTGLSKQNQVQTSSLRSRPIGCIASATPAP